MTNNNYRRVEKLLYNYKMIKINIENNELEIEHLRSEDGMTGISYDGIRSSPTNKTGNPTEDTALSNSEKIHYLEHLIGKNKRLINSIDRAMEGLSENERIILEQKYIEGKRWWQVGSKVGYGERHCKRIRTEAINRLIIGIYNK